MKERTIDILTAVFLIAFSFVMRGQLEGIPREGVLFPLCVAVFDHGVQRPLLARQGPN